MFTFYFQYYFLAQYTRYCQCRTSLTQIIWEVLVKLYNPLLFFYCANLVWSTHYIPFHEKTGGSIFRQWCSRVQVRLQNKKHSQISDPDCSNWCPVSNAQFFFMIKQTPTAVACWSETWFPWCLHFETDPISKHVSPSFLLSFSFLIFGPVRYDLRIPLLVALGG